MIGSLRAVALGLALLALASMPRLAEAREVQMLRTPGGIGLWLVEEHGLPLVALRFAIRGGSLEDPPGKEGAGDVLAALLDQGAGPLDAQAFQGRLEALGSRLSFSISRAAFLGGFLSISRHLHATAELFRLALIEPRLRLEDFERTRRQKIAEAEQDERHPERKALQLFIRSRLQARQMHGRCADPLTRLAGSPRPISRRSAASCCAELASRLSSSAR
jgi:zinc protease